MWFFVVKSFTRYNTVGRRARNSLHKSMLNDGYFHLRENMYVRYCSSGINLLSVQEKWKESSCLDT